MGKSKMSQRSEIEYVSLFHISVKEYRAVVDALEKTTEKNKLIKLKIQIMMLRKYITNGENVHVKSFIPKIKKVLPHKASEISQYYSNFESTINKTMIHVNAVGEEQDVRDVFNDVTYGYFLHADFERVERLGRTNQMFLWGMIEQFNSGVEEIIYQLDELIIKEIPTIDTTNTVLDSEPVIRYADVPESKKNNLQGVWKNLVADKISDDAIEEIIEDMTEDDLLCFDKSSKFMMELGGKTVPSIDRMRSIVLEENIEDWGDFKSVHEVVSSLKDCGLSSRVSYSEDNQIAWMKVLREVGDGFVISDPQQIRAQIITLCRNYRGEWRVFAFGGKADPIKKTKNLF